MSIVWRDKVLSSYNGNIESVKMVEEEADYPNGLFIAMDGPLDGYREVKRAKRATTANTDVLLLASPEVLYENGQELNDFLNPKDGIARAFRLADGDVFTLTVDLLADPEVAVEIDSTFSVDDNGQLANVAPTEEGSIKFKVREDAGFELTRDVKAVRFEVVK